jgi:predicted ATPase
MAKLKIKNVGSIKEGFESNDGYIDFKGVTVFIGNQGSGKSTIAKLYSTLSWIEKALVRGDFTDKYVMQYNRFKKHLAYQNLSNYLNDNSHIDYIGDAYRLTFEQSQFCVHSNVQNSAYSFPKIMYVPAERNFVSSVDRPDLVKRLPLPLYTFMDEYEDAKQRITESELLPIDDIKFEYKKQNKKSYLVGKDYSIELLEASSGFQSLVPLVLVTRHLSETIKNQRSETRREINREEEEKIRRTVTKLLEDKNISEDVMRVVLEKISAKFKYESFINVVEEPEQNLYPTSQKSILFELLKHRNENPNNKLIITTHSPYIISFLSLAIQASYLKEKTQNSNLIFRISSIVPINSTIDSKEVLIYQLENNGIVKKLIDIQGIPSDKNFLNKSLEEGNILFDSLLEIEQEL